MQRVFSSGVTLPASRAAQSGVGGDTPAALRDRMNPYFFASGILYESLKLIRAMNKVFAGDKSFETSLRLILKGPRAKP
jgi:hypothetical protein